MTKRRAILVAIALLAGSPGDSAARPCGASIRKPASRSRERCVEQSEIVGRRLCSRFGSRWDITGLPDLTFEAIAAVASVPAAAMPMTTAARTVTAPEAALQVPGGGVRALVGSEDGHAFVGGELVVGIGTSRPLDQQVMVAHAAIVLGAIGRLGRLRVRPELALGIRHAELVMEPTSCGCPQEGPSTNRAIVVPRVALEWRATPRVGVIAFAGVDVIDRSSTIAGLGLTLSPWSRGF